MCEAILYGQNLFAFQQNINNTNVMLNGTSMGDTVIRIRCVRGHSLTCLEQVLDGSQGMETPEVWLAVWYCASIAVSGTNDEVVC